MPLSIRPEKSVCGFTRAATTMASGARRLCVAVNAHAAGGRADFNDVHLADDRGADGYCGNAQAGEHLALSKPGAAPVGSHRGDKERLAADVTDGLREPA